MEKAYPPAGAPDGFRLPSSSRITRTREIREVLRSGRKKKTSHLDVFFLSSGVETPRIGLIVPKYGGRIVDRNRLKRRVREVVRREVLPRLKKADQCMDVLVRVRREAYRATYQQLRRELVQVCEQICSG
jgi:ribonuclease P protein component